jgi:hypothetical protein
MVLPQSDLKPYLTAKEVVSLLATHGIEVTDDTVRLWVTRGLKNKKTPGSHYWLSGVRIGGRLYVVREELAKWIPLVQQDG